MLRNTIYMKCTNNDSQPVKFPLFVWMDAAHHLVAAPMSPTLASFSSFVKLLLFHIAKSFSADWRSKTFCGVSESPAFILAGQVWWSRLICWLVGYALDAMVNVGGLQLLRVICLPIGYDLELSLFYEQPLHWISLNPQYNLTGFK